jgi:hypothetical protein
MATTSHKLEQLLTKVYSLSTQTTSVGLGVRAARDAEDSEQRALNVGSASAGTTQAVITSMLLAGMHKTKTMTEIGLGASGLSLMCTLPSAIEAIKSLGVDDEKATTEQRHLNSLEKTEQAFTDLIACLGAVHTDKRQNILRLLFGDEIVESDVESLFTEIKTEHINKTRGDAIKFCREHFVDEHSIQNMIDSFDVSLASSDEHDMPSVQTSLFQVASMLSLLNPDKDQEHINRMTVLFKGLLTHFRKNLASDIACAGVMDQSNRLLIDGMVTTYTGRALRKKNTIDKITKFKHVLTGIGIVLSVALAIHTAGITMPLTALFMTKVASSTVSAMSSALSITKILKDGNTAEDIAQLLTPAVVGRLQNMNVSTELLRAAKDGAHKTMKNIQAIESEAQALLDVAEQKIREIMTEPLVIFNQLSSKSILQNVLNDDEFMSELENMLNQNLASHQILQRMQDKLTTEQVNLGSDDHVFVTAKLKFSQAIATLAHDSTGHAYTSMKQQALSGRLKYFVQQHMVENRERHDCYQEHLKSAQHEFGLLRDMQTSIHQEKMELKREVSVFDYQSAPSNTNEKMMMANHYVDSIQHATDSVSQIISNVKEQLKESEQDSEVAHVDVHL